MGLISSFSLKANKAPDLENNLSNAATKLPFRISLNTSTIRFYKLKVEDQIDAVAKAGFNGIELWVNDVDTYLKEGGSSESLAARLKAGNLVLENMIGFAPWYSDDQATREKGIEQLRQEMLMTAKLGGKYIAAPVQGIKPLDKAMFETYIQRFLAIVKLSDQTGVIPILELWGHGALSQLAEGAYITIATGHPSATMLLDFYHLYRGGNPWKTLDHINCSKLPVFHINDFPGNPTREQLKDSDRVFPGDGICPFKELIPKLYKAGFRGGFSVELFNQGYWDTMDVQTILRTSYEKTHKVIKESMAGVI
jgi:2-keto-myo-inositol isomerase